MAESNTVGPFTRNVVAQGDSWKLVEQLPDESIDVLVTSPPYWGQRASKGSGVEEDPRQYVADLRKLFELIKPKMKQRGICWINIGDAYNTPVNWRADDHAYSSLGPDATGLAPENSAYSKPRHKRKAFTDKDVPWLTYGNLLSLPYRLVIGMSDDGWLSRGEVIWKKKNPMPEGRCRRPHRQHESIHLLAKDERHNFQLRPPVGSVWEFGSEKIPGLPHYSRFPLELPKRCIDSYGIKGEDVVVFDPFSGSGTTGVAAAQAGCSFIGFEIDDEQVLASNERILATYEAQSSQQKSSSQHVSPTNHTSETADSSAKIFRASRMSNAR
ncbi:site-specific DNA-methyltransferase [Arthrobacter echini]|uniref:Methyltransferase n=1 Tax=Arthrobacter echini TaxID=1529066 RepID=A0A5D0XH48_9MICC|nr:site-specific DNA-methyltransferase [Arthrobacter echini]TYC95787.1 site-specific DNA-methyltransferase [Arthrobacter echini]